MSEVSSVMLLKGSSRSFYKTSTVSFFYLVSISQEQLFLTFSVVSYFQSGDVLLLESKWPIIGWKPFDI